MRYLKIMNDGELDIRLVHLMGGTTKSKKEELIGNFGSGLKYSLAYLLRNNLSFKIFIGEKEVEITSKEEQIRDEVFDIIYIDGEKTSITTNMGRDDWEPWMIIRELWSNALDEGGATKEDTKKVEGEAGKTTFFIQIDKSFQEVLEDWEGYFKVGIEPIFETTDLKIYNGGKDTRLYKQGVLIYRSETPSVFHYDFGRANLNELREYKDPIGRDISSAFKKISEPRIIELLLEQIKEVHTEANVDLEWFDWDGFHPAWTDTIGKSTLIKKETYNKLLERGKIEEGSLVVVPDNLYGILIKEFPFLSAVKVIKGSGEFIEEFCEDSERAVSKGLTILEHCKYSFNQELSFRFGTFEDRRVNARIDIDNKVVYFSTHIGKLSLAKVVAILIEENEHYVTGYHDETREFQQHFIDLYTKQLLDKYEIEI